MYNVCYGKSAMSGVVLVLDSVRHTVPLPKDRERLVSQQLTGGDPPVGTRQLQLPVEEFIIETDFPRVFGGIGEVNHIDPCPVYGSQAHRAGLTTGIDFTTAKVECAEPGSRFPDRHHLRVGRRVVAGDHLVVSFRNDHSARDDDRAKWTASPRPHLDSRKFYRPGHEFRLHLNTPFVELPYWSRRHPFTL